ncbi:MAG: response regulator [Candidatus Omnitrophota bacterium]
MNDKKKSKILIVDDDPDILTVMEAVLLNAGFDVIKAFGGREAIGLAEANHPDLILLDVRMPGMDGVETTDILRNKSATKDIPIAYLTNLVEEKQLIENRILGSKIGNLFFIPKTYSSKKIIEMINLTLRKGNDNI